MITLAFEFCETILFNILFKSILLLISKFEINSVIKRIIDKF